jgi:Na+/H+ antiporter NhaC
MQRMAIAGALFAALCGLAAWFGGGVSAQPPWYSIVPPALAIVLAFLTRNVIRSLGAAVLVGAFLGSVPPDPTSLSAWVAGAKSVVTLVATTATSRGNLLTLAFIPPIFMMVETILAAGGFRGIMAWLLRRVRTGTSAQLATATLGIACFIDDYASAIITGSMMQPITDRFRISRAKLAFLVDATSAPVAGLAVISTWIAYETSLFTGVSEQLGLGKSGYALFFDALSYRFYCLLMLVFVYAHLLLGRDFGPMRQAEEQARPQDQAAPPATGTSRPGDSRTQNGPDACHDPRAQSQDETRTQTRGIAFGNPAPSPQGAPPDAGGRATTALLPLAGLLLFHITGLWLDGGGPARLAGAGSLLSPAYWREIISTAPHCRQILLSAALFGTLVAILCGRRSGTLAWSAVPACLYRGLRRAALPAAILILAWSLKNCCEHLGTGRFLAALLADRIPAACFPPLLFLVACVVAFSTGTSYGTMAILIPTAIPIAFALDGNTYGLTTVISLGAVLDGAIFGDHASPISDTTILSATASSCDLVQHTRTQLPYSLFVAAVAVACAYTPSALGLPPAASLGLSILVILTLLVVLGRRTRPAASPLPRPVPPSAVS